MMMMLMMQEINGDEDDEDKYADDMAMPGQKFETKQRITVRNLRIREDTAKVCHVDQLSVVTLPRFVMWTSCQL